jgi:hypothetical protein
LRINIFARIFSPLGAVANFLMCLYSDFFFLSIWYFIFEKRCAINNVSVHQNLVLFTAVAAAMDGEADIDGVANGDVGKGEGKADASKDARTDNEGDGFGDAIVPFTETVPLLDLDGPPSYATSNANGITSKIVPRKERRMEE